ncbi:Papain-like cysteine peptidase superfamily [Forsythia ovata]|uniref:Papain-like cysteine peptidase superfamily n=1 Tax=Forsythia ovata TaxID=205694 RepID=A0ABD1W3C6_9LAMI
MAHLMASSHSASKLKRKCRKRNNTSTAKRNRHNKARTKPVKDNHNIPVPEGENISFWDLNATILRNQTNHVTVSSSNVVPINEAVDLSTCKTSNHVVVCTSTVSKQAQAQAHIPVERIVHSRESKGKDKLVDDTSEIKKSQERCNSNDVLKRCFSEIHRKHEILVADHFRLKFHFQYLCNEFAESIADGLNEVNRLCAAKQSPCSKMASFYKKSYAANMKVAAMNTDSQHPGSSLKGRGMRPCETKTIDEAECPSFDLGIDSQSNVSYIELDDGILRTQDDIMIIDDIVARKIPESHQTDNRVESSKKRNGDCGIFVIKFAEYIFGRKIKDIPKKFDTKVARHNMAVQLYRFASEKPELQLRG